MTEETIPKQNIPKQNIPKRVFIVPFKNSSIYIISTIVFSIPEILFLKTLYKYNQLPFTNLFILHLFSFKTPILNEYIINNSS